MADTEPKYRLACRWLAVYIASAGDGIRFVLYWLSREVYWLGARAERVSFESAAAKYQEAMAKAVIDALGPDVEVTKSDGTVVRPRGSGTGTEYLQ